jgi:type IX secretion system PorP/SprF family membrane protein
MKKLILGLAAATMMGYTVQAQDVHFSQYFSSPLTLNPALTGLTQCDLRLAANYRNQWSSVSDNPYMTGTVSFDIATLKDKLPEGDALGVGLLGLFDKSGSGALQNITIGLSVAYHKAFGAEKQHTLSFGLQGYLVQKSIDFSKLTFEDQYDPTLGLPTGRTNESTANADLTYPDFNLGLMYSGRLSEFATLYGGVSYYHLTQPVETFMSGDHKIASRLSLSLGGSFSLNENLILYASGLYQSQGKATETMIGGAAGIIMNPGHDEDLQRNTILYLGAWYRYGDALCPYVGLEWSKMQVALSYDANISRFTPATQGNGAYELSLIFNGCINKRDRGPRPNVSCPRF